MSDTLNLGRNPDALTAHLASGGDLDADGKRAAWTEQNLARLRELEPGVGASDGAPLDELKQIYTIARVTQGSIVAGCLALPATIEAGQIVRDPSLPEKLDTYAAPAREQTERFLTGTKDGKFRPGNDYPQIVRDYIATVAGILRVPYGRAYEALEDERPDLLVLAHNADELQRLCWGHIRAIIDQVVPAEEVAQYRQMPLREGTEALMALIRERTGVSLPVRVMQRDDWREALANPRQDSHVAVFNSVKFFVENAEISLSYCIGSLVAQMALAGSSEEALQGHVRHGVQEIAAGTRTFTHGARFQSRVGARPNDYRSFREFSRNVRQHTSGAVLRHDGSIAWPSELPERGYCPAQNRFVPRNTDILMGFAEQGRAAIRAWRRYGLAEFGVQPLFKRSTPGELLGGVVVFATAHEGSPLRPESEFIQNLAN